MTDKIKIELPRRSAVIRHQKEHGGKVAAVFPVHYPRAVLRAFDILPIEVWGPPSVDTSSSDAHLQAYTCGIVRNGLAFLLGGGLDPVDFLVVPHACDSLQGLGSMLIDFIKPKQPVLPLYIPRGEGDAARQFLAQEIQTLFGRLVELTGRRPTDADLMTCIRREEQADTLLTKLLQARRQIPLTDRGFYRLLRSREFVPSEDFISLAQSVLDQTTDAPLPGKPLLLSGIVPEPMEILEVISRAGGIVVGDDWVCVGRRAYPVGESENPFLRLAQSLLGAPPDSTRGSSVSERTEYLIRLAKQTQSRGVIFYDVKFCEPEQYYIPLLRQSLEGEGLRVLSFEGDLTLQLPQQSVTRLEAFLETLE